MTTITATRLAYRPNFLALPTEVQDKLITEAKKTDPGASVESITWSKEAPPSALAKVRLAQKVDSLREAIVQFNYDNPSTVTHEAAWEDVTALYGTDPKKAAAERIHHLVDGVFSGRTVSPDLWDHTQYETYGVKALEGGKHSFTFPKWEGIASVKLLLEDESATEMPGFTVEKEGLEAGAKYRFEITYDSGATAIISDPFARQAAEKTDDTDEPLTRRTAWSEIPTAPAPKPEALDRYPDDKKQLIYEVHLPTWVQPEGAPNIYRARADALVAYAQKMNYTHVELMGLMAHPNDMSMGYQVTGYFSPNPDYGTPDDVKYLIQKLHENGIRAIMDWVPNHAANDPTGPASFPLTYDAPHKWGCYDFNFAKKETTEFLLSSANYWLEEFGLDGLRVDAVASIWGNGGRDDGVLFLQLFNAVAHTHPKVWTYAETSGLESKVTTRKYTTFASGTMGFDARWNLGLINGFREYLPHKLDYGLLTEPFDWTGHEHDVTFFSHDEVIHGKGPLSDQAGDIFLLAHLYLTFMPGLAKGDMMGNETKQDGEWEAQTTGGTWKRDSVIHVHDLDAESEKGKLQAQVAKLNRLALDILNPGETRRIAGAHDGFDHTLVLDSGQHYVVMNFGAEHPDFAFKSGEVDVEATPAFSTSESAPPAPTREGDYTKVSLPARTGYVFKKVV